VFAISCSDSPSNRFGPPSHRWRLNCKGTRSRRSRLDLVLFRKLSLRSYVLSDIALIYTLSTSIIFWCLAGSVGTFVTVQVGKSLSLSPFSLTATHRPPLFLVVFRSTVDSRRLFAHPVFAHAETSFLNFLNRVFVRGRDCWFPYLYIYIIYIYIYIKRLQPTRLLNRVTSKHGLTWKA